MYFTCLSKIAFKKITFSITKCSHNLKSDKVIVYEGASITVTAYTFERQKPHSLYFGDDSPNNVMRI